MRRALQQARTTKITIVIRGRLLERHIFIFFCTVLGFDQGLPLLAGVQSSAPHRYVSGRMLVKCITTFQSRSSHWHLQPQGRSGVQCFADMRDNLSNKYYK